MDDDKPKYSYSTKRPLGSGAFADVFLGSCRTSGSANKIAVKRIDKSKMQTRPKIQRLLRNEVTVLRELRGHDNIVRLYDCFEDTKFMHLVLEYCDGGDLSVYLKRAAPLSESIIHDLLSQLSRAIQHARARNIVHRDLKPQNILLHKDANHASGFCVKLTDFGFACRLTTNDMTQTFCGSPLHMAPEILAGGQYDPSIDLWSIGTIAYQMATGFTPYRANNMRDLKQKLREAQRLQEPLPIPPHVSPEFTSLVAGLLEVDPKKRISFDGFFAHPFFHKQFVPKATEPEISFADIDSSEDEAAPKLVSSLTLIDPTSTSFIIVDKRATEFAQKLDHLCVASTASLSDDVRQIGLRELAMEVVYKSTLVLQVAQTQSLWEKLLLYGRALIVLRDAASRAREFMDSLGNVRPCRQTIVAAQKFHNCMSHCLSEVDRMRRRVYELESLGSGGVEKETRLGPAELLYDAAMQYAQRGARHEQHQQKLAAETLYRSAITLLLMVRQECRDKDDLEKLDRYLRSTERRLHIVTSDTFSQVGATTMAMDSHHLGAIKSSKLLSQCLHETLEQSTFHATSAPIDIPGAMPRDRDDGRARFCGSCGMRFAYSMENFCTICGTQRTLLISGVSLNSPAGMSVGKSSCKSSYKSSYKSSCKSK